MDGKISIGISQHNRAESRAAGGRCATSFEVWVEILNSIKQARHDMDLLARQLFPFLSVLVPS